MRSKSICTIFLTIAAITFSFVVNSEEVPKDIGTVKVTADREAQQQAITESPTSFVTVIDGKELDKYFRTVPEAISDEVGVRVNQLGGLGSFSTISIRGSTSDQVMVFLDGVLVNEARGGGVDISEIPLFNVDSIEIYRGNSPLRFGQSGIGGIVNIKTRIPEEGSNITSSVSYGSFETYKYSFNASHSIGNLRLLAGINYTKSDNDFEFLDDNGTIFTTSDDRWVHRKNNRFRSLNITSRLEYDVSDFLGIAISNNLTRTFRGVPGIESYQSETASIRNINNISRLELEWKQLPIRGFKLETSFFNSYELSKFKDRHNEIGVGFQDNHNVTESFGGTINLTGNPVKYLDIEFLVQLRSENFKPEDKFSDTNNGKSYRTTLTLGTEDSLYILSDKIKLTGSVKTEMINDKSSNNSIFFFDKENPTYQREYTELTTWQTGIKISPFQWMTLRGNVGKYFRIPNFFELYGDKGGIIGNPEILSETGNNRDIGIRLQGDLFKGIISRGFFEAVYFDNEVKNLILFIQNSQRTFTPENIGKARIKGAEFSMGLRILDHLDINGNYTKLDARDRSGLPGYNGKFLPGRPKKEYTIRFRLFNDYGEIYYNLNKVEKNYLDRINIRPTKDREIHNIGASLYFGKYFTINFEAKNLNDSNIEDLSGFPIPGRAFFVTVTTNFKGGDSRDTDF